MDQDDFKILSREHQISYIKHRIANISMRLLAFDFSTDAYENGEIDFDEIEDKKKEISEEVNEIKYFVEIMEKKVVQDKYGEIY